jgi:trehalose synthase
MQGFARHVVSARPAHLLLAGPDVSAVTDDPEGAEVLAEVLVERERLPAEVRSRVHIACLPMTDLQENAAMVNAIQRRSDIVVQKSLAEGFGLTVAEAMWKGRPVVASRRGGIQDQIEDGVSGVLLDDPADLEEFGRALGELLDDPGRRAAMGAAARARVEDRFLGTRHLLQYFALLRDLLARKAAAGA